MIKKALLLPFALFDAIPYDRVDQKNKWIGYSFFVSGIILNLGILYYFIGSILFSGEMFAEEATDHFANAHKSLQQLMIPSYGYLVFPQRLISLITHELGVSAGKRSLCL